MENKNVVIVKCHPRPLTLTIHASSDSYAVEYAEENRMDFVCE